MPSFTCASHGHCFDGLVSAALFTDLIRQQDGNTDFSYRALGYGPTSPKVDFSSERNALLDYRYIPDKALTYYLDHHPTAFSTAEEREHFESRHREDPFRFVHDSTAPSCANLVGALARDHFGHDTKENRKLEALAEKIDAARFESIEEAIDEKSPIMRLVSTVTHFGDHKFYERAIPLLLREGVDGLAEQRFVKDQFSKLAPALKLLNQRIRKNGAMRGRVAMINLLDRPTHVVSKFRQYYEFPQAMYSILLLKMHENLRISVGYNPWSSAPCDVHIGRICQSFGGGGHAVVGAIGLTEDRESEAIQIADTIALALQTPEDPLPP